jgi:tRNA(Ile)-lysidine synthase
LKKLLQEAGVPPWERDTIPLLYVGEELAAVAGLWIAASFAADPQEDGLVLEWQKPLPSDNL